MLQWRKQQDERGECNRAVVVSVVRFDPGVELSRRLGAKRDSKKIHRTLSKLGFKVELHDDLTGDEIYELFLKESKRPVKDCFLAVLSSHGKEGCVFGADGQPVRLSRIFSYFDNEHMEKKAKLFLIQACRGDALDDGVEVDSAGDTAESSFSQELSIPVDTAVMYATVPGYGAFMHQAEGSIFLQTFCSLLEEEGNRNLELTRLMTRLSHRVAYTFQAKGRLLGGKKEMPCLLTRLTREVFPFAEPAEDSGAAGISATSLVGTEIARTRTPSISYGAFMHQAEGSIFLQTFCSLLEEEGNRNLELTRLMTRLSHRVAYTFQAKGRLLGGKKEMPCLLTRLTREVFPFAEPAEDSGAAGISATSLVGTEIARTRTPSIS